MPKIPPEKGNMLGLVHGAYSERVIAVRADELRETLLTIAPDLADPRFRSTVDEYLRALARAHLLDDWIQKVSAEQGVEAVNSRTWEQATTAAAHASRLGSKLALDPVSAARLRSRAVDAVIAGDALEEHLRKKANDDNAD